MAAEYGVLPSVALWGSEALEQRSAFHVAFDFAAYRRLTDARKGDQGSSNHANLKAQIQSGKRGKRGSGGAMPRFDD